MAPKAPKTKPFNLPLVTPYIVAVRAIRDHIGPPPYQGPRALSIETKRAIVAYGDSLRIKRGGVARFVKSLRIPRSTFNYWVVQVNREAAGVPKPKMLYPSLKEHNKASASESSDAPNPKTGTIEITLADGTKFGGLTTPQAILILREYVRLTSN